MFQNPFLPPNANPYQNMDVMKLQLESQLQQVNKVTQSVNPLAELQNLTQNLNQDEKTLLFQNESFLHAKQIYEVTFIDFLLGKFSQEYLNTSGGQESIKNLISVTKSSVDDIKKVNQEKQNKVNALVDLMESDSEIQKLISEKLKK